MAGFMFLTDDEFREDFADHLDQEGDGPDRLTDANRRKADKYHREAANLIRARFLSCGVPDALIGNWFRGRDVERNLGLYFAYRAGSLGEGYDQEAINEKRRDWALPFLDREDGGWDCSLIKHLLEELCPADPATLVDGGVGFGRLAKGGRCADPCRPSGCGRC